MHLKRKSQKSEISKKAVFVGDGIKQLDIMGEKFKFNYERQGGKYRTRLGGLVSIIVAALSLVFLVIISRQYFDTSSPVVTTTRELSTSQSFNIVGKELFSGVAVSFVNVLQSQILSFMTMKAQLMRKSFDPRTNTTKTVPLKMIRYISCSASKDQFIIDLLKKSIEDVNLEQFICPVFKEVENNVTLSSDPEKFSSTYLSFKFYPCSLPDRNQCFPLQLGYAFQPIIPKISNLVSPSNYEDPLAFHWEIGSYIADMTRTRSSTYLLQLNRIIDDRSVLGKAKTKEEYGIFRELSTDSWERNMTQNYCTTAMIDAGECDAYVELVYQIDKEVVITKRRYKKIPVVLGEFGGVLKLLTTAFVILSFYYSRSIKSFLFNQGFGIEKCKAEKIMDKTLEGLGVLGDEKNQGNGLDAPQDKVIDPRNQGEGKFSKKNKFLQNSGSLLKKYKKQAIHTKTDIVELAKKINLVDILDGAYLKKHHEILLPLVTLISDQTTDQFREAQAPDLVVSSKNSKKEQEEKNTKPENKNQDHEVNTVKSKPAEAPELKIDELSEDQKNYAIIKQLKPQNHLESILTKQILSYLSVVYEHE